MTGVEIGLAIGVGLLVGLVVGLLGVGGSVLTVPALMLLLGFSATAATATALVVVVAVSTAGLLGHARKGRVDWRSGAIFALVGLPAAAVGGRASVLLSDVVLTLLLIVTLAATAVWMWRREPPEFDDETVSWGRVGLIGTGVGAMTGLLGVGGGFVVVPALSGVLGLSIPVAIGTSQLVLVLNALAGLAGRVGTGVVNPSIGATLALAGAVGSVFGSRFVGRLADTALTRIFAALLGAICAALLLDLVLG